MTLFKVKGQIRPTVRGRVTAPAAHREEVAEDLLGRVVQVESFGGRPRDPLRCDKCGLKAKNRLHMRWRHSGGAAFHLCQACWKSHDRARDAQLKDLGHGPD